MLEGRKKKQDRSAKHNTSQPTNLSTENGTFVPPNDESMTRKPIRIRRQRVPILQSGYCAICNLPYNSLEDHIQSKKHQKLIGVDANYIALNGYIHADVGIESLLSLTGIDAIGFDDFSPKPKRRTMPRTRASSVVSDIVKSTQKLEKDTGLKLRSRKNVNYMTPPPDEDSFQEKPPDLEPVRLEYKEYRELRSSTRALAKLTSCADEPRVWESGRPKRSCINRHKRFSSDERLGSDNQSYYKVEVLSNKHRPNDKDKNCNKPKESKSSDTDKGLIVKFKKLRNSELIQLNNEATNFLFPKKDESSSEDEEEREEEENKTEQENESTVIENSDLTSSSEIEDVKPPDKFKVVDEVSMDSTSSDGKTKRKRRSHAEAFIMDNQKYYKFETPGSSSYRLRYHGSYLSPVPTAKANGDFAKCEPKVEPKEEVKTEEEKNDILERLTVNLNEFTFSFERIPEHEKWYQTFQRQDRAEQRYHFCPNYHWNDFVLPHQIPHLKSLDPRICYKAYKNLKECICKAVKDPMEETSESDKRECDKAKEDSSEPMVVEDPPAPVEHTDEDSKLSEISSGSVATTEEIKEIISGAEKQIKRRRGREISLSPSLLCSTKNARKSPRQHASTLAILSSLGQQRKRRSRNPNTSETSNLQTIPEEPAPFVEVEKKCVTPQKQRKKKIDYFALAAQINEELNSALDFDIDFTPTTQPDYNFLQNRLNVNDILKMYDQDKAKENENSCRRFFNGAPGRKPGKRKKNLTGWPTMKKRKVVKEETNGVNESEEDGNISDSIIGDKPKVDLDDTENKCDRDNGNRVEKSSDIRDSILQPYVYVKKIDNCEQLKPKKIIIKSSRKALRRPQRRIIPPTTKTPRMLRRHKGRWYRDR